MPYVLSELTPQHNDPAKQTDGPLLVQLDADYKKGKLLHGFEGGLVDADLEKLQLDPECKHTQSGF